MESEVSTTLYDKRGVTLTNYGKGQGLCGLQLTVVGSGDQKPVEGVGWVALEPLDALRIASRLVKWATKELARRARSA